MLHLSPCSAHYLQDDCLVYGYAGMATGTYLYLKSSKPPPTCDGCKHQPAKEDEEEVWGRLADVYDAKIGKLDAG